MNDLILREDEITEITVTAKSELGKAIVFFVTGGLCIAAVVAAMLSAASGLILISLSLMSLLTFMGFTFAGIGAYTIYEGSKGGLQTRALELPIAIDGKPGPGNLLRVQIELRSELMEFKQYIKGVDVILSDGVNTEEEYLVYKESAEVIYIKEKKGSHLGPHIEAVLELPMNMEELERELSVPVWSLHIGFDFPEQQPWARVIILDVEEQRRSALAAPSW